MNLPVFFRRLFIVLFSLCLIINIGYNVVNSIKSANLKHKKALTFGTIKIYSVDKAPLDKILNTYFANDENVKITSEDIYGNPIYYITSDIGINHFQYVKKYFHDNDYKINVISSSDKFKKIKIDKNFISTNEAEKFSKKLKEDIGIECSIIAKTDVHRKIFCIIADNITLTDSEKIASENSTLEIKWTKSTKK